MWFYLITLGLVVVASGWWWAYTHPITVKILIGIYRGQLISKYIYQFVTRIISKKLVEIHHKRYVVWYPYGVHWYRIVIPRVRGPSRVSNVLSVVDSTTFEDVTDEVKEIMGPCNNFHGIPTSPKMLGYSKLIFKFAFDSLQPKLFKDDETIEVSL